MIAVIGANGQLGSDLVEVFEDVIPLTHNDVDVTDPESLKKIKEFEPDVVINTAAYVRVDDAETEVDKAFRVNAVGALNVARVCNEINAVNVFISTDYVFDGEKGEAYVEEDMANPINVYGASKYTGEIFTRNYSGKWYVVRVASLYGKAGARGKGGNFVEAMIRKAKNGEEIKVVDDIYMSPTYTKDVAEMLGGFLELRPEYGVYHMVNEGYCNWYELTREIFDLLGWDVELTSIKSSELNRVARRPAFSVLENKGIERLGLRMRSWQKGLKGYLGK